jgi:hypothetical protein
MKKVAILGVGPAGLMAGYAASLVPNTFVSFFSAGGDNGPTKSKIGGAQFLHRAIPGIHNERPDGMVRYITVGSPVGYKEKVYGSADVPFVSMSNVADGQEVPAWSLSNTYDRLWDLLIGHGNRVNVVDVTAAWLAELLTGGMYDLVVCTVPRPTVCLAHAGLVEGRPHAFVSQPIRFMPRCTMEFKGNRMIYDGTKNVSWYRTSSIFGVGATEWSESAPERLPYDDVITIKKPISHDCSCFDGHVVFTGRVGAWRKGVLTHHAFIDTFKAMDVEAPK